MILGVLALAATQSFGQQIAGPWTGQLDLGAQKLTLVLHFDKDASGKDVCTIDSPDQSAKGIPATLNFISADSVNIAVPSIGMTYAGKLEAGVLKGTFSQMGMNLPLDMKPGVVKHNRPQHPVELYPYQDKEIAFQNEAANAWFAGTLVYPEGYKEGDKVPVLIMVTGSGAENRDEEIFDHKPFLVIADYLARHGIATLRYDDRATAKSVGGDVENATTEDFMRDAAAGVEYLRSRKAFGKTGVLGHSEGGSIAFMLGARKKTDFIVSLAGPGVKGDTLLAAQNNMILVLSGQPATMTVETLRRQTAVQNMPWVKWFIDYDPSDDISKTRCPVFALNGDLDCQVISIQNLPAIRQLLPSSKRNLIKEYPSLNHLFQHCTTGLPDEYGQIEETLSPEVLSDIAEWINWL